MKANHRFSIGEPDQRNNDDQNQHDHQKSSNKNDTRKLVIIGPRFVISDQTSKSCS